MEPLNPFSAMTNPLSKSLTNAVNTPKASLSHQVPAKVSFSDITNTLQTQTQRMNFVLTEASTKPALKAAMSFMLNTYVDKSEKAPNITSKKYELLGLGPQFDRDLPKEIILLAKSNHVSLSKLSALAKQEQGYLLPEVNVNKKTLQFASMPSIALARPLQITDGNYLAKIVATSEGLALRLNSLVARAEIKVIDVASSASQGKQDAASNQGNTGQTVRVQSLISPAKQLSGLINKLEKISLQSNQYSSLPPQKTNVTGQPEHKTETSTRVEHTSDNRQAMLRQALMKSGAIPAIELKQSAPKHSLASVLLTALPQFIPPPMAALATPDLLAQQIKGLSTLQLTDNLLAMPVDSSSQFNINLSAITLLFQLLIGLRVHSGDVRVSEQLLQYLQKIQSRNPLGAQTINPLSQHVLSQLQQAGITESLAQTAAGFQLYQQASADNPNHWFFAIPFLLNQTSDQMEGHFEQLEPEDEPEDNPWRLQLKFNLQESGLFIKASKKNDHLAIVFESENLSLLERIALLSPSLQQKLVDIGFTVSEMKSQQAKVPATLLPGDHYLVQGSV